MQTKSQTSHDDLKRAMSDKTDEELYEILGARGEDYTAEAIEVAREEFAGRNLDPTRLTEIEASVQKSQTTAGEPLKWPLRLVAFFFSTPFFGIPVILAWRYFYEKGAKRKAHDWATWAVYGLGFHATLYVLELLF